MAYNIGSTPIIDSSLALYYDPKNPKCYPTYNLFKSTENLTTADWDITAATISPNVIANPINGAMDADKLVESATTAIHRARNNVSNSVPTIFTQSIYAKAAERTELRLTSGGSSVAYFDLINGTLLGSNAILSHNITPVIDGWYRVSITYSHGSSVSGIFDISIGTTFNYQGDGVSGLYLWGAQLEKSYTLKPYQPITTTPIAIKDLADANNGTLINGAIASQFDGILTFDGTNDYVDCGAVPSIGSSLTGLTVSVWIKPGAAPSAGACIMENGTSYTNNTFYMFQEDATRLSFEVQGTTLHNARFAATPYTVGIWHYLVGAWSPNKHADIYLNGVLNNGSTLGSPQSTLINGATNLFMGSRPPGSYYYKGDMALPMIYNRALSAAEILQNYEATKHRFKK